MFKLTLLVLLALAWTSRAEKQDGGFLDFCTVQNITQGFFTGTENDPTVPNSNCVYYFVNLQDQVKTIINELNYTLVIPTNALKLIDDVASLINRYSLWQNYCIFATLITKLDNVFTTIEGITGLFYKLILNYAKVIIKVGEITLNYNNQKCFETFRPIGEVVGMLLDYHVPEDIV